MAPSPELLLMCAAFSDAANKSSVISGCVADLTGILSPGIRGRVQAVRHHILFTDL